MQLPISIRNNVNILGNGNEVIMFAHGFGCDQNMWRHIIPAFKDNYKIVLFDYVGSGSSDSTAYNAERYSTLEGYAKDVLDICEELKLSNIIYVGHSVSCMIGMLAANEQPKLFSKIIMVSPSPSYINDGDYIGGFQRKDVEDLLDMMDKNYMGWANFFAPNIIGNAEKPELALELTQSFCSTDPIIARRFAEVTFFSDNRKDLKFNKLPTLVLQASDDMLAPISVGNYLHDNFIDSKLSIMNVTGHCAHMSHPNEVIQSMKSFLN